MALPPHLQQFSGFVDLIVAHILKEIEAAAEEGAPARRDIEPAAEVGKPAAEGRPAVRRGRRGRKEPGTDAKQSSP
jgi:hypothetical protein